MMGTYGSIRKRRQRESKKGGKNLFLWFLPEETGQVLQRVLGIGAILRCLAFGVTRAVAQV